LYFNTHQKTDVLKTLHVFPHYSLYSVFHLTQQKLHQVH